MTDPSLDKCFVQIDPTWEHRALWRSPLGRELRFTYVDFESGVGDSNTPNYADTDITGRAEPFKAHLGNPSKEISISMTFVAQTSDLQTEVVDPARFLDALKYGLYDVGTGLTTEAPPVYLKIGTLFFGRCVLISGDPQYMAPIDVETLLPHQCKFDATFAVTRKFQSDLSYRFDGQWF